MRITIPFLNKHYNLTWRNAIPSFFAGEVAVNSKQSPIPQFVKDIAKDFIFKPIREHGFGGLRSLANKAYQMAFDKDDAKHFDEGEINNFIMTTGFALGVSDAHRMFTDIAVEVAQENGIKLNEKDKKKIEEKFRKTEEDMHLGKFAQFGMAGTIFALGTAMFFQNDMDKSNNEFLRNLSKRAGPIFDIVRKHTVTQSRAEILAEDFMYDSEKLINGLSKKSVRAVELIAALGHLEKPNLANYNYEKEANRELAENIKCYEAIDKLKALQNKLSDTSSPEDEARTVHTWALQTIRSTAYQEQELLNTIFRVAYIALEEKELGKHLTAALDRIQENPPNMEYDVSLSALHAALTGQEIEEDALTKNSATRKSENTQAGSESLGFSDEKALNKNLYSATASFYKILSSAMKGEENINLNEFIESFRRIYNSASTFENNADKAHHIFSGLKHQSTRALNQVTNSQAPDTEQIHKLTTGIQIFDIALAGLEQDDSKHQELYEKYAGENEIVGMFYSKLHDELAEFETVANSLGIDADLLQRMQDESNGLNGILGATSTTQ